VCNLCVHDMMQTFGLQPVKFSRYLFMVVQWEAVMKRNLDKDDDLVEIFLH
jgi:hypothetical protein